MSRSTLQLASDAVRAADALSKALEHDQANALFYSANKALRHLWFVQGTLAARQRTRARACAKAPNPS